MVIEVPKKRHEKKPRILLYHGWLADYGFPVYRPSGHKFDHIEIDEKGHRAVCLAGRYNEDRIEYGKTISADEMARERISGAVEPISLIVLFPREYEATIYDYRKRIEAAGSFEEAAAHLRELAHSLPCTERPLTLDLFHSTKASPNKIMRQGMFSPCGYIKKFKPKNQFALLEKWHGQISGDGICTTREMQGEETDGGQLGHGKKTYGFGNHQYKITLDSPAVLLHRDPARSIIDWYIKLRHDFGLLVYECDSNLGIHEIASTCNRLQGLPFFARDLGYDVIETECEYLIKREHIEPAKIIHVGSL